VVTHQRWRGEFARGTFGAGPRAGQSSDCTEYPATNGCLPIRWPGWNTTAWQQEAAKPNTIGSERFWFGTLAVGMRDATGQLYRRNRYYDPRSGQFTQPDPIGLAGGLNSYGFAAGDPVSYADPYGLCWQFWRPECRNRSSAITYGDFVHAFYNPKRLMTMDYIRGQAASLVAQRRPIWGTDDIGDAKANAFRHIFGACTLTRWYDRSAAQEITRSHEEFWREGNSAQAADSRDDSGNNEIGMTEATERENRHLTCENIADRELASGHYYGDGGEND
jgi:RHS repeat-associated protein